MFLEFPQISTEMLTTEKTILNWLSYFSDDATDQLMLMLMLS